MTPVLEKLLILQGRDRRRLDLEKELKGIPADIAAVERKIQTEKEAIETAKFDWHKLEARKKDLENEIATAEQKAAKYRTQQLEVRKNDEFRALGHEIETVEGQIGALEETELNVLYEIEAAKAKFAAAEQEMKTNISGYEARIRSHRDRENVLAAELAVAKEEVTAARLPLGEPMLRLYDRIALRNMPVCVPLSDGKCGGCHLKVSSEVESAVRAKPDPTAQLPACDQCGRIVYRPSLAFPSP